MATDQQDFGGEGLLLLQETAARNLPSSFFNEPAVSTNPFSDAHLSSKLHPCSSCGSTHKRPSSENPTNTHHQPSPKKPNTTSHSASGFSKISLSSPAFLRRCSSDPYNPPLPPVVEEPQPNLELDCPETPLSKAIGSNKLPPRPPTLRRSSSDPIPSPPSKAISKSSDSPPAEWLRKMRDCTREMSLKLNELLGDEEDPANEVIDNNDNSNGLNNDSNNDAPVENYEEGHVEAVSVEKKGEALILHFKCPCGTGYQIVLSGGNCYYKLM